MSIQPVGSYSPIPLQPLKPIQGGEKEAAELRPDVEAAEAPPARAPLPEGVGATVDILA
jgi:hypothetical protein